MSDTVQDFVMPEGFTIERTEEEKGYAVLSVKPLERGFAHTLGNALRRILLSSIEGVAVKAIQIDGVAHEFSTIPDVLEDVTEIVLNFKKLKLFCDGDMPRSIHLHAEKAGPVTAGMIQEDSVTKVLNPDLVLLNIDKDRPIHIEIHIDRGRGYRPADENKDDNQAIGMIPVDCLFTPVRRVSYNVRQCRVGQKTNYDQLMLEVWSDERLSSQDAVYEAAGILQLHANRLVDSPEPVDTVEESVETLSEEEQEMLDLICKDVGELDLSVRSKNCLRNSNVTTILDLILKPENELLKFRNFGKKSLKEINDQLCEMGLSLEMELPEAVQTRAQEILARKASEKEG
jgi:DNA-directed RNA polymerase subunit alpha